MRNRNRISAVEIIWPPALHCVYALAKRQRLLLWRFTQEAIPTPHYNKGGGAKFKPPNPLKFRTISTEPKFAIKGKYTAATPKSRGICTGPIELQRKLIENFRNSIEIVWSQVPNPYVYNWPASKINQQAASIANLPPRVASLASCHDADLHTHVSRHASRHASRYASRHVRPGRCPGLRVATMHHRQ